MKNVRLYARVSTEEQRKKDFSVPAQLEKLERYCKDNDYNIIGTYIDNGISAATIIKRKDFCKMLNDLQHDDIILFTRLDRMSRNILDSNMLLKQFAPLNVTFKAIQEEDIDVTTADGKFLFDLKVSLAERERKKTSERIKDVFEHKLSNGNVITGKLPKGYKRVGGKATIIEKEAEFVRDCFNIIEHEQNTYQSMRILNNKHHLNYDRRYYARLWRKECYIGKYREYNNIYPPIISKEQYYRVQEILDSRYIKVAPTGKVFLFSGLLICTNCNRKLGATTTNGNSPTKKYKVYRCTNASKGEKTHCCYSEKKLEKRLLTMIEPAIKEYLYDLNEREKEVAKNKDLIKSAKQKIARLQELYIDGKLEKSIFDRKYTELSEIISTEERKTDIVAIYEAKEKYNNLLNDDITTIYSTLTDDGKRKFWRSFVEKIIVKSYDEIDLFLM